MTNEHAPTDQHLNVEAMQATTVRLDDDPPELELILDVEHADTGHVWRQALRFTKPEWIELMTLLAFVADGEGIEWQ